ncbi:MAG TPA: Crp/Fnr family transcriptional regulator [Candidatus Margulisiibacteriota bacterium]|nr:Crp/Fnr family transcriptional regulator [Candidatus Margulisiibacteriota bacterium]
MDDLRNTLRTTLEHSFGWPTEAATEVAQYAHIVSYDKNATVFHAGEVSDLLYVLLSGEVRLYYGTAAGERLLVTIIRGGQLFGTTDFQATDQSPGRQEQLFTAQTLSRSKVAMLSRTRVARVLQDLPAPDLVRIVQTVDASWVSLCCRLLTFLTQDVRSRLAYSIREIAKVFGIPDARGKLIALRLSHEDFAELIGASRPMVSKHLKELAEGGIFVKENGRYVVLQEDALAAMAASGRPAAVTSCAPPSVVRGVVREIMRQEPKRNNGRLHIGVRREQVAVRSAERMAAGCK